MKIHNRALAATVAAATALALAGCTGGGTASTPADGEVTGTLTGIFFSAFKDTYEEIAANFEKKYPGVDVKFDYQGGDVGALVMTQLQGGTAPDILLSFPGGSEGDNSPTVVSLAAGGRIVPLEVSWAGDVPDAWKSGTDYDGKTYAYPGALQPLSAMYNQDKLDELGVEIPTTLDELYQLCDDAVDAGVYAYSIGLGDAAGPQMVTFAMISTLQPDPREFEDALAAGETTYADSVWVDQFEAYQEMGEHGCFGEGALGRTRDQAAAEVASGAALGTVDVGAVLPTIQTANPEANIVVSGIPATNDAADTRITALPGFVTTVNAKAKNMTAAQAFLEFMNEPEQANIYADGFAGVPAIPNDAYKAPAVIADFAQLVADGNYTPLVSVQAEVQTQLNQSVQSLILGDLTPLGVAEKLDSVYKKP